MGYGRFLTKRVLQGVLVVWGVITVVFLLRIATPGSPITVIAPLDASQELRRQIAAELGLNKPIYVQYADYLWNLLHLDMGQSYISNTSVAAAVFARLQVSLELAVAATVVAVVLSIPLGVVSATRRHELPDYAATLFSLGGISTPNFWLGLMLVLLFAVYLGIFPTSGIAFINGQPVLFADAIVHLLMGERDGWWRGSHTSRCRPSHLERTLRPSSPGSPEAECWMNSGKGMFVRSERKGYPKL